MNTTKTTISENHLQVIAHPRPVAPVVYFAIIGVLALAFMAFVLTRWVTGPYFTPVLPGVTPVPTFMKVAMTGWTIAGWPAMFVTFYYWLYRPWKRAGAITSDGILVLALATAWFSDPLSNWFGYYYSYNTYMFNYGSWVNSVPGWQAGGKPGATLIEPILWVIPFWVYGWVPWLLFGQAMLRKTISKWPNMPMACHLGLCWLAMGSSSIILEGVLMNPLGIFQYGGTHFAIFPTTYHKYPLLNIIFVGWMPLAFVAVRFFRNERDETLFERGASALRISSNKKVLLRFLAMVAGVHGIISCTNLVHALVYSANMARWPDDVQSRSYFTSGICGQGTERACQGPGIPNPRGANTIGVTPDGKLYVPAGVELPKVVPLSTKTQGPFRGPLISRESLQ